MLPVAAGDLMPDDELDNSVATAAECNNDDDEFLPSETQQSRSLTKLEDDDDDDEFTASLMAAAARGNFHKWEALLSSRKLIFCSEFFCMM